MPLSAYPNTVIIDGDIERKIISIYTPDFYKDNPLYGQVNVLLKNSIPPLDYMLEMARGLPYLVDVYSCPPDLLKHLGALIGYTWKEGFDIESQRQEIAKSVDIYLIRGTSRSVVRLALNTGASIGDVFTPFEWIFHYDSSHYDYGFRYEDMDFWRWGTYEVIADVDFEKIYDDIGGVHPAGTKWFGRQLIPLGLDVDPDIEEEFPQNTKVYHTYSDNYSDEGGLRYRQTILDSLPTGYWKLDEEPEAGSVMVGASSNYGMLMYGSSPYGGASAGIQCLDSSGNGNHGTFGSEEDILDLVGDGTRTYFGEVQLEAPPIIPSSVLIVAGTDGGVDDGQGKIVGSASGTINYNSGIISALTFDHPPGAASVNYPILPGSPTMDVTDSLRVWIKGDDLPFSNLQPIDVPFTDSVEPVGTSFTAPVGHIPVVHGHILNDLPAIFFGTSPLGPPLSNLTPSTPINLGDQHTIFIVLQSWSTTDADLMGASDGSRLWLHRTDSFVPTITDTINYTSRTDTGATSTISVPYMFRFVDDFYILTIVRSGSSVSFFVNDSPLGFPVEILTGGDKTFTFGGLGAVSGFFGYIAEVLLYDVPLGPNARKSVSRHLGAKYDIFQINKLDLDVARVVGHNNDKIPEWIDSRNGVVFQSYQLYEYRTEKDFWYKADTLLLADNALVNTWPDGSGSGHSLVGAGVGSSPTFIANAAAPNPGVRFSTFSPSLDFRRMVLSGSDIVLGSEAYVSVVFKILDGAIGVNNILYSGTNSLLVILPGGGSIRYVSSTGSVDIPLSTSITAGAWHHLLVDRRTVTGANRIRIYLDNSSVGLSGTYTAGGNFIFNTVGDNFFGYIAEFLGSTASSSLETDRVYIRNGFKKKWGVGDYIVVPRLRTNAVNGYPALEVVPVGLSSGGFTGAHLELNLPGDNLVSLGKQHTISFVATRGHFSNDPPQESNLIGQYNGNSSISISYKWDVPTDTDWFETLYNSGVMTNNFDPIANGNDPITDGRNLYLDMYYMSAFHVFTVRRRERLLDLFIDGDLVSEVDATEMGGDTAYEFNIDSLFNTGVFLNTFGDSPFFGKIARLLVLDVALDDDDIELLHRHLAMKYAIPFGEDLQVPIHVVYNDYVQRGLTGALPANVSKAAGFRLLKNAGKGWISIPSPDPFRPRTGSFSLESWVKLPPATGGTIFGNTWAPNNVLQFRVDRSLGVLEFYLLIDGNAFFIRGSRLVSDDLYHHVAFVVDVTMKHIEIWMDGVLDGKVDYPVAYDVNPGVDFFIGAKALVGDSDFILGVLDEVAYYKSALTSEQIIRHYAMGTDAVAGEISSMMYMHTNIEPIESFGSYSFKLDQSFLGGPDILDGVDVANIVVSEWIRVIKNAAGAKSKLGIADVVKVSRLQARVSDAVMIGDKVTRVMQRPQVVSDRIGIADAVRVVPTTIIP